MNKREIHQKFIDQLQEELDRITDAAKKSIKMATDEGHKAEGKYDTFSLEASYLARGQAQRVQDLATALERFQLLPLETFGKKDLIKLSALVELQDEADDRRFLFFGPDSGGLEIEEDDKTIMVVTSKSPLGQAILGKVEGETFTIKLGPLPETFKVVSVA